MRHFSVFVPECNLPVHVRAMVCAVILAVCVVLMWLCCAEAAETSRRFRRVSGDQMLGGSYLHLPGVLHFRSPPLSSEYFSPKRGTGSEPLPSTVRELLLPFAPTPDSSAAAAALKPRGVVTSCEDGKMRVFVPKSVLGSGASAAAAHLSLGTCPPTTSTGDFVDFEIVLNQCQTVRTVSWIPALPTFSCVSREAFILSV